MPRLFDAYIMVDWSAASRPTIGRDSIWIAELDASTGRTNYWNPPTRSEAFERLSDRLLKLDGASVLLGFDFSLGYPAGTAKALGLPGKPWSAMHDWLTEHLHDDAANTNNRFDLAGEMNRKLSGSAGPFWGVTSSKFAGKYMPTTKPDFAKQQLPEFRRAEQFLRDNQLGAPKSSWQLAYIGSVGSQSLTGIPMINRLRRNFPNCRIWPFETGFTELNENDVRSGKIIIAEIYPSLTKASPKNGEPLDKAQVRAISRHYWELDKSGLLGAAFAPPDQINTADLSNIDAEEGWILGITPINIGHLAS